MIIRNISDHTISENLFGRLLEIPSGYSINSKEFWGTEVSVAFLAIRHKEELKVMDDNGNELTELQCPCCGEMVKISSKEKKIEEVVEEVVEEKPKIKRGRK
jgi:transcription initiation factor IIE alpha subunit